MALIIRSSAIHAAGCYTTTPVRKGTRVAEYTGPRISKAKADKAYDELPITYLFGLGEGTTVIDGHCMAMFINHSCDPNCETEEIRGRVWITAIRNIPAGQEITYDYCLYDGADDEAICNCGAKKCRGTMYSREEVRRRKTLAKKAAVKARKKTTAKRTETRKPARPNPAKKKRVGR
jgi:SET domain-containing protein